MSRPIRFLLDGQVRELADVEPTLTVLNWLRYEARRTGTKEGCAEGDCGACTVVLGELEGGRVRFRAVNACILFVPMLDGRALFTVESLGREGALHPIQQAMVDSHGSQCGFCTPGFVMSLYAHQREGGATDAQSLKDMLAGNLCRCTGYGPILAAGQAMGESAEDTGELAQALANLRDDGALAVGGFLAPRSADGVAEAYAANPDATILAGGTDVGLWVTKQGRRLPTIISINEAADLRTIETTEAGLRIGAAVRYADAEQELTAWHPAFGELLRRLGGRQVRNLGTVCGNIANGSPIGDMPPALIAAGARLVLRQGSAERHLALEDYYLAYGRQDRRAGEFVEAVIVPPIGDRIFRIYKISKRLDQDITAVCAGVSVRIEGGLVADARVAFGGMAGIPQRAVTIEAALIGQPWTPEAVALAAEALAQDFTPIDDMRASASYRLSVAKNLLVRACLDLPNIAELEALDG
jgi:xanthine dehydrogenase small subunit